MQYPIRHNTHTLEQKSEIFFLSHCPQDWSVTTLKKDYGQDLNIEICQNGEYRGLDLIVQLKSSATPDTLNNTERQQLKVSTFNYLQGNLRVVLLVKYIEEEDEAYWILLRDVDSPASQTQENFTVYFPRENKLSEIDWAKVVAHVQHVTDTKTASMRMEERENES